MRISDWSSDVCSSDLMATTLIDKKTAPFKAEVFHDHYVDALRDLVESKRKHRQIQITPEKEGAPRGDNIIDLMAALKGSLEKPGATTGKGGRSRAKPKDPGEKPGPATRQQTCGEIGRASCRERVGQYSESSVVGGILKKKNKR